MAVSAGPDIVESGLILCLDAANPRSYPKTGTGWFDNSKSNFTGILNNGITYRNDVFGNFLLDSVDDYINFPQWNYIIGTDPYTMNIWFKTTGTAAVRQIVFGARRNSDDFQQFVFAIVGDLFTGAGTNTKIALWNKGTDTTGTSAGNLLSNKDVVTNEWINVTGTITSLTTKIYINGILDAEKSITTPMNLNFANPLFIGAGNTAALLPFGGQIAYAQIYNKELTSEEVLQNFNALRGRFGL